MTTILLQCESRSPAYDQRARVIVLERETDTAWIGRPQANPACPTLIWPKFAWREIHRDAR